MGRRRYRIPRIAGQELISRGTSTQNDTSRSRNRIYPRYFEKSNRQHSKASCLQTGYFSAPGSLRYRLTMTSLRLAAVTIFALVVIELASFVVFASVGAPDTSSTEPPSKSTEQILSSKHDHHEHEMYQHERYSVIHQTSKSIADNCITHPNISSCWNFTLPNVEADIAMTCKSMPSMVGCSIKNICTNNAARLGNDQYCQSFSILKDLCTTPGMSNKGGCVNFTSMCAPDNTVVEECATPVGTLFACQC